MIYLYYRGQGKSVLCYYGSESTDDTFSVDGVDDMVNGIHVDVIDGLF